MAKFQKSQFNFTANADQLFKTMNKMDKRFKNIGSSIGAGLAGIGGASVLNDIIMVNEQFIQSMNNVQAVTNATATEMQNLEDIARQMGSSTRFSATQAAEGLSFLAMAGLSADEAISALPGVLQLATAGLMDLGTAADIATNVMSAFGLEVEELARVNEALAKTATSSNTTIEQLGGALKFVGPTAAGLGVSLEEVNAVLATFANRGIRGFLAGTNLRAILNKLINPSKQASKVFKEHGIVIDETALATKGLTGIFEELSTAQLTAKEIAKVFGTEISSSARILLESTGTVEKYTLSLVKSSGAAAKMAKIMDQGLPGAMRKLNSVIEELKLSLLEDGLLDAFTSLVDNAAGAVKWIAKLDPVILAATTIFLGLTVAVTAAVAAFTALNVVTGGVLIVIGLIVTAIASLVAATMLLDNTAESFDDLNTELSEMQVNAEEVKTKTTNLINELAKLQKTTDLTLEEEKRRIVVINDLIKLHPHLESALKQEVIDLDNIKTAATNAAIAEQKLIDAQKELVKNTRRNEIV